MLNSRSKSFYYIWNFKRIENNVNLDLIYLEELISWFKWQQLLNLEMKKKELLKPKNNKILDLYKNRDNIEINQEYKYYLEIIKSYLS